MTFPADPDPAKHEPEETGGATLGVAFRDFWRMVLAHIERGMVARFWNRK